MIINDLRKVRKENRITQIELANAVGTTRQSIYAIESGKSLPGLELALRMAYYFDVNLEELFHLEIDKDSEKDTELFSIFGGE